MRAFAGAWPDARIVQRTVAQLPWRQNITLLERLSDPKARLWYAEQTIRHGWSQPILALQIAGRAHERQGKAVNNFKDTLPPADSDLASQVFKDPYLFDFLGPAGPRREREVEQALVDHVQRFLLELGSGFAFVGRQVRLEVGDETFLLDLLFYHLKLRRYEIKMAWSSQWLSRPTTYEDRGSCWIYPSATLRSGCRRSCSAARAFAVSENGSS